MKIKKLKIWGIIGVVLISFLVPNHIFAENKTTTKSTPLVCAYTPNSMQLFLDFQRDAINLIHQKPFPLEKGSIGNLQQGLFSEGALELEINNTLLNTVLYTTNSTTNLGIYSLVSALLFTLSASSVITNNATSFAILFAERPIVRDWAKIMDLEREISKLVYYIGTNQLLDQRISDTEKFETLLEEYKKLGLFTGSNSLNNNISYASLISFLGEQNKTMKYFLLFNATNGFDLQNPKTGIYFSKARIDQLISDYLGTNIFRKGSRWGFACNSSLLTFKNNIKSISNNLANQSESSTKIITNSIQNLLMAYGISSKSQNAIDGESYLSQREKELLKNVYKMDTRRMTKENKLALVSLSQKTLNNLKALKKDFSSTTQLKGDSSTDQISLEQIIDEIKNQNPSKFYAQNSFDKQILQNIIQMNQELEKDFIWIANGPSTELTLRFGELSNSIKNIILAIGNKESGIRKTLNTLCSTQASNKGTKGCYIP